MEVSMNKRWVHDGGAYFLYFCPYGEDINYAGIAKTDDVWVISSKELKIEYDTLDVKTLEEAKEEVEEMVRCAFKDVISYYEDLLKIFDYK